MRRREGYCECGTTPLGQNFSSRMWKIKVISTGRVLAAAETPYS